MARVMTDTRRRLPAPPRLLDWHCDAGHAPAQWCGDRTCPRCGGAGTAGRIPGGPAPLEGPRGARRTNQRPGAAGGAAGCLMHMHRHVRQGHSPWHSVGMTTAAPSTRGKLARPAVFGLADGLMSMLGVVLFLLGHRSLIFPAALSGGISSALS